MKKRCPIGFLISFNENFIVKITNNSQDPVRWSPLTDVVDGYSPTLPHLKGLQNGDTATSAIKQVKISITYLWSLARSYIQWELDFLKLAILLHLKFASQQSVFFFFCTICSNLCVSVDVTDGLNCNYMYMCIIFVDVYCILFSLCLMTFNQYVAVLMI